MKVLLINDFFNGGGAETVFREHLNLFQESKEFEVEAFFGSREYCHANNVFSYLFSLEFKKKIQAKLDGYQPDLIHLHGYYHILSPSIFVAIANYKKKHTKVKILYTAHDYHFLYPNSSWLKYKRGKPLIAGKFNFFSFLFDRVDHRGFKYSLVKKIQWIFAHKILRIIDCIDIVISPSEFLKGKYEENLGLNVYVIRNPTNFSKIHEPKEIHQGEPIRLVFFGRIAKEKGIVEFVSKLSQCKTDFILDIFGSGEEENNLKKVVLSKSLEEKIRIKGLKTHSEILSILPEYHSMIIPSLWYENAPMSIVEAAINGLYVIGSDIGGITELSSLFAHAILYDPDKLDCDELFSRLRNLKTLSGTKKFDELRPSHYLNQMISIYN